MPRARRDGADRETGYPLRPDPNCAPAFVIFDSSASNLVSGDTNNSTDVFQRLMGHSDPKLTARVYTHLELEDLRGAVDALDPLPPVARWQRPSSQRTGERAADGG
jgi:integrase